MLAGSEFVGDQRPDGIVVADRIAPAERLVLAGALMLGELQFPRAGKRNFSQEQAVADAVKRVVKGYRRGEYVLGVASIEGSDISTTVYSPRAWLDRGARHFARMMGYDDVVRPFDGQRVEGYFLFHGFARGDKLGYSKELGRLWYLHFGWGEQYYAPVERITAVNLRVVDNGF